jgi:small subunit ribosomal protein S5
MPKKKTKKPKKEEKKPKKKPEKKVKKKTEKKKEVKRKPEKRHKIIKKKIEEKRPEVKEEKIEKPELIKKPEEVVRVEEEIEAWIPKTSLGKSVIQGKVTDINKILESGVKIKEHQIVDRLVPNIESELVLIGGRPGKGGGIQRTPIRISAKMHRSGRRYSSTAFAIVGNKDGIVGIGKGRGKETRASIEKAIQKAKLNIIKVPRGCGSWECECGEPHSIPFKTKGKSGSVRVELIPAPKGIGLAVDDESKKILRLAGIKDVWGRTLGDTGTRFNLIKAVFNALKNLHRYRVGK